MLIQMSVQKFKKILPKICGKDTSFDPKGWNKKNLFWGQSAVVSLLAHSIFKGQIMCVALKGTKFAKLKFHLWNVFADGHHEDFTRSQFGAEYPGELEIKEVDIPALLEVKSTVLRFQILQERFEWECKKGV